MGKGQESLEPRGDFVLLVAFYPPLNEKEVYVSLYLFLSLFEVYFLQSSLDQHVADPEGSN